MKRMFVWVIYELSGIRAIWEHIEPPTDKEKEAECWRPAPTFTLWAAGIYTALFGLASARYEHAVDRVETRAGAVVALLANDRVRSEAAAQVALIQNREVPKQPKYFDWPPSFFDSFVLREPYEDGIEMLKTAVESCKKELSGANLSEAILERATLYEANLELANLSRANLERANLSKAKLMRARLEGARLERARLPEANLQRAYLQGAYLFEVNLEGAYLHDANLRGAYLIKANLLRANLQWANLEAAYLQGANLQDIQNWKEIQSIEGANITGVRNAPDGFIEWALENGAVIDEDPAEEDKPQ